MAILAQKQKELLAKGVFFFGAVVILSAFAISVLIQGVLMHLGGESLQAVVFYLIFTTIASISVWVFRRAMGVMKEAGI